MTRSTCNLCGLLGLLILLISGCARLKAGPPTVGPAPVAPPRPRAEWMDDGAAAIWARHLGQAQRALLEVADREVRRNDPARLLDASSASTPNNFVNGRAV